MVSPMFVKKFMNENINKSCPVNDLISNVTSLTVFLSVPPTIIGLSPENVTVVVNNFVSLSCEATGFPPPTLSWLNDKGPIQGNTNALIMPGTAVLCKSKHIL